MLQNRLKFANNTASDIFVQIIDNVRLARMILFYDKEASFLILNTFWRFSNLKKNIVHEFFKPVLQTPFPANDSSDAVFPCLVGIPYVTEETHALSANHRCENNLKL